MGRLAPRHDPRPAVSDALRRLEQDQQPLWVRWAAPRPLRLLLGLVTMGRPAGGRDLVLFVDRGRFGLGLFIDHDGWWAWEAQWLLGRGPDQLRIRDIRAVVLEHHPA